MNVHEVNYCTTGKTYESLLIELNKAICRTQELGTEHVPTKRRTANLTSKRFLELSGISSTRIRNLNVIHVAGSKGKGSTCALIENVLRAKGLRTGTLNSPHLIDVEERIRINGRPLPRDVFASRFWELHGAISEGIEMEGGERILPTYLVYLTTLAFKTFVEEQVDVAVIEVGCGGRFDHTNVVEEPVVTVVTGIHLEHTNLLGNTIEEIAWNKAGIFKPGVPAVVAYNIPAGAMRVFEQEAELVKCPLFVAPSLHELESWTEHGSSALSKLGACIKSLPASPSTEINASLALSAVHLWFSRTAPCRENFNAKPLRLSGLFGLQPPLHFTPDVQQLQGLSSARWPGRFERIELMSGLTIFLDCAHTNESVQFAAEWFQRESVASTAKESSGIFRILLFTVLGSRDPLPMLASLQPLHFDCVFFVGLSDGPLARLPSKASQAERCLSAWRSLTADASQTTSGPACILENSSGLLGELKKWKSNSAGVPVLIVNSDSKKSLSKDTTLHVLGTGSVHLVGDILKNLRPEYEIRWT